MAALSNLEFARLLLTISILIVSGKVFGHLAQKLKQPAIAGELLAGIILGPSLIGYLFPDFLSFIYPKEGNLALSINTIVQVALIFTLFSIGMEIDFNTIQKNIKNSIFISISGILFPLITGFCVVYYFTDYFIDPHFVIQNKALFGVFIGVAMSITSLPILSKTLLDLNFLHIRAGSIIISSAMVDDLLGWGIFSILIALIDNNHSEYDIFSMIVGALLYATILLLLGKTLIEKMMNRVHDLKSEQVSLGLTLGILSAAITAFFGVHGFIGSFLMGIIVGNCINISHIYKREIKHFIYSFFSPIFFVTIGMSANFINQFNFPLVAVYFSLALITKFSGIWLATRYFTDFSNNESKITSWAMTTKGAMEIIVATVALQHKFIDENIFVAIVIVALMTSMLSGMMMKHYIKQSKREETLSPAV